MLTRAWRQSAWTKRSARQRLQRRPIEALEEIAPRARRRSPFIGRALRSVSSSRDARVQRGEGEEGLVAQPRENPALGDLDGDFDFRFVARLRRSRRDDRRAVVPRPVRVGPLELGS